MGLPEIILLSAILLSTGVSCIIYHIQEK